MYQNIFVAVDGSEDSDKALLSAVELASQFGSELHLVFAIQYQHYAMGLGSEVAFTLPQEELEAFAKELLDKASAKAREHGCKQVETHQVMGEAGQAITELAKENGADLIVVGSKGHSDIAGFLLGSVSHKICHLAPCPCLVVR